MGPWPADDLATAGRFRLSFAASTSGTVLPTRSLIATDYTGRNSVQGRHDARTGRTNYW
jgi:hypothetical protein